MRAGLGWKAARMLLYSDGQLLQSMLQAIYGCTSSNLTCLPCLCEPQAALSGNWQGQILLADGVAQALGRTHALRFCGCGYELVGTLSLPYAQSLEKLQGAAQPGAEPVSPGVHCPSLARHVPSGDPGTGAGVLGSDGSMRLRPPCKSGCDSYHINILAPHINPVC